MNATAAVRGLFSIPRAGPPLGWIEAGEDPTHRGDLDARAQSIKNVLARCGYTVTQLSAATRRHYGSKSPYFIPVTFLYKVRSGVTPHLSQVVALSESTGYRFTDWLRMFGFDLRQVHRLQMRLHTERTVLVTPDEESLRTLPLPSSYYYDGEAGCASFRAPARWKGSSRHLFARIGTTDALVFPQLMPGSVVRVDRCYTQPTKDVGCVSMNDRFWLVEQPGGLTCTRVRWIDEQQIVPLPCRPPWGKWPLRLPTEARILGLVDTGPHPMTLPPGARRMESGSAVPPHGEGKIRISELLRISRARTGLTFRAAHGLTRTIAHLLGSQEYAIALGLLSDYEAMSKLPRHIAKIMSLCIIYCMDIRELLQAAEVSIDDSAKLPLPGPDRRAQIPSDLPDQIAQPRFGGRPEALRSIRRRPALGALGSSDRRNGASELPDGKAPAPGRGCLPSLRN